MPEWKRSNEKPSTNFVGVVLDQPGGALLKFFFKKKEKNMLVTVALNIYFCSLADKKLRNLICISHRACTASKSELLRC